MKTKKMFKLVIYTIVLSIFVSILNIDVFANNDADTSIQYSRIEGIDELKEHFPDIVQIPNNRSLPSSVDLTSHFPTPGNQGSLNDGIEWAICYLKDNLEQKYFGWNVSTSNHQFNPEFIFNQINGGYNLQTNLYDAVNKEYQQGICTCTYRPISGTNYTSQPTDLQKANAALYKSDGWYGVNTRNGLKQMLYDGLGVLVVIRAYSDFDSISSSNQVYDTVSGSPTGEYVLCLIGYDNNKSGGAFKFINSKGTSWGVNGYGWISYSLMEMSTVSLLGVNGGFLPADYVHNYTMGDVTGDGHVTSADARLVLRYAAHLETPTNAKYVLADVDGNASVTSSDAQAIQQYAAHTIPKLPIYN